jgi:methionyl-tRNA formyltransferase
MRLMFFGAGAFGVPTLASLAGADGVGAHSIVGVVTQPDRPAGRGLSATPSAIAAWASAHRPDLPLLKIENVNEPGALASLRGLAGPGGSLGVDAWLVIAFGQKLSVPLLAGVRAMNLHGSLLPRWRGAAPVNAAILAGDAESGNTVITLADRMDAGLILGQSRRAIEPSVTAGELHDLLSADGPGLVRRVLDDVAGRGLAAVGVAQDERLVTRAGKFSKADGWVDWSQSAEECRRRVHGLTPWPGVTVQVRGQGLKLLRVAVEEEGGRAGVAGTLVSAEEGLVVCGGGSVVRILNVQPAGGRAMSFGDFARGRRLVAGEMLVGGAAGRPSC